MSSVTTPIAERTLWHVLNQQLQLRPDKVAVRDQVTAFTYAELLDIGARLASGLEHQGVQRGAAVLVMLDNTADAVATWVGLSLGGYLQVPVNTAYKGDILRYVVRDSGAAALIVEAHYIDAIDDAIGHASSELQLVVVRGGKPGTSHRDLPMIGIEEILSASPSQPEAATPDALLAIMYTSGTTGASKGVLVAHAHAYTSAAAFPVTHESDVVLVTLPLFHIGGMWAGVYNALIAGATAIVVERFSATTFWDIVHEHACTTTFLLGVMADFLWRQPPRELEADNTLHTISMTPVLQNVVDFKARFGVEVDTGYGLTEAGSIIMAGRGNARPGGCGWARSDVEVRLVDSADREVERGQAGELVCRPAVAWTSMAGYHGKQDETLRAWRNLWFHTGDLFYQDESLQFFFVDRQKDALRRRGENVSSMEVEAQLMSRPEVAAAAVVAVPSTHTEDEIKAVIVLEPGRDLDLEDLYSDLAGRMPYFMVPRYFELVSELPLTPTQKVKKADLRAAGLTDCTWDAEQAGLRATRRGLVRRNEAAADGLSVSWTDETTG